MLAFLADKRIEFRMGEIIYIERKVDRKQNKIRENKTKRERQNKQSNKQINELMTAFREQKNEGERLIIRKD